ncbi:MAG TPA: BON domain-containing protein [Thermoanaerobaculia bacterium]|nr:BON domain-containing protein [Thermoanaerobaculia bacterium]
MNRSIATALAIAAILFVIQPVAQAATADAINLTEQFRGAGAAVDRLQVYEIAGIVIIRGRTADKAQAEDLARIAKTLGYERVANLVQIADDDDERITRAAEVELTVHRALDGCKFQVNSSQGVVHVAGQVRHELQKDVALQVLRQIDGVRAVEFNLSKF